jgi:hypothetical protein
MKFNFKIDILDGIREFLTGKTDCLNCGIWFDVPEVIGFVTDKDQDKYEFCSTNCKLDYEKDDGNLV